MRSVVVLPQPLGPSSTRNSPSSILIERSSTAITSGLKALVTCESVISAISPLTPHCAEGHAAQQVIADDERKYNNRQNKYNRTRRQPSPLHCADANDAVQIR